MTNPTSEPRLAVPRYQIWWSDQRQRCCPDGRNDSDQAARLDRLASVEGKMAELVEAARQFDDLLAGAVAGPLHDGFQRTADATLFHLKTAACLTLDHLERTARFQARVTEVEPFLMPRRRSLVARILHRP
jgi:hypothetical protein